MPIIALIHFALAWQLIRRPKGKQAQPLGLAAAVAGIVLYMAMVWPALAG